MDAGLTIAEGSCLEAVRENLDGCKVLKATWRTVDLVLLIMGDHCGL